VFKQFVVCDIHFVQAAGAIMLAKAVVVAVFAPFSTEAWRAPFTIGTQATRRPWRQWLPAQMMSAVGQAPNVKVGDMIPDVSLDSGFPPDKVSLREFTKGKRVVLVGLPGAFTPT